MQIRRSAPQTPQPPPVVTAVQNETAPQAPKLQKKSFYVARSSELHQKLAAALADVGSLQAQIDENIQLLNRAEKD